MPVVTAGPATPLSGSTAAARPVLHGINSTMHVHDVTPTSSTITSIATVNKSPSVCLDNNFSAAHFKQTTHNSQGD
jgi:hypothetical protein